MEDNIRMDLKQIGIEPPGSIRYGVSSLYWKTHCITNVIGFFQSEVITNILQCKINMDKISNWYHVNINKLHYLQRGNQLNKKSLNLPYQINVSVIPR